jgi:hypothetical protein
VCSVCIPPPALLVPAAPAGSHPLVPLLAPALPAPPALLPASPAAACVSLTAAAIAAQAAAAAASDAPCCCAMPACCCALPLGSVTSPRSCPESWPGSCGMTCATAHTGHVTRGPSALTDSCWAPTSPAAALVNAGATSPSNTPAAAAIAAAAAAVGVVAAPADFGVQHAVDAGVSCVTTKRPFLLTVLIGGSCGWSATVGMLAAAAAGPGAASVSCLRALLPPSLPVMLLRTEAGCCC